jgi:hypothetical protein
MMTKKDICNHFNISYYLLREVLSYELSEHLGISKEQFVKHRGYFNRSTSDKITEFFKGK